MFRGSITLPLNWVAFGSSIMPYLGVHAMNELRNWKLMKAYEEQLEQDHESIRIYRFITANGYHPNLSLFVPSGPRITEYPRRYIDIQGNVVKIRHIHRKPNSTHSLRDAISEFSMKSRKRLMEFLISIDWDSYDVSRIFEITLTYHENIPRSGTEIKQHRHVLRKNILDKYPGTILIWKLEFQKRGAPHFHMIMIAPHEIKLGDYYCVKDNRLIFFDREEKQHMEKGSFGFRAYMQMRWNAITEEGIMHLNSGIEVEKVRNPKGMPQYLAQYIAGETKISRKKEYQHVVPEHIKNVGRWWGCNNKKLLKIRKMRRVISEETYNQLEEWMRSRWKERELKDYKGHEWGLNYYAMSQSEINSSVIDILLKNEVLRN
jgi:hypothetical protein